MMKLTPPKPQPSPWYLIVPACVEDDCVHIHDTEDGSIDIAVKDIPDLIKTLQEVIK